MWLVAPRDIARAVGAWLPALLAVVGVVLIGFELLVTGPQIERFSREGRAVNGRVTSSGYQRRAKDTARPYTVVTVEDPELGVRNFRLRGLRRVGENLPMRCLTSARNCLPAQDIDDRRASWPVTPLTLAGAAALVLAAAAWLGMRWAARRRL